MQSNSIAPPNEIQKKFDVFFQTYQILGTLLNDLPINPFLKDKITHSFDTGFLWIKESLLLIKQIELNKSAIEEPKVDALEKQEIKTE